MDFDEENTGYRIQPLQRAEIHIRRRQSRCTPLPSLVKCRAGVAPQNSGHGRASWPRSCRRFSGSFLSGRSLNTRKSEGIGHRPALHQRAWSNRSAATSRWKVWSARDRFYCVPALGRRRWPVWGCFRRACDHGRILSCHPRLSSCITRRNPAPHRGQPRRGDLRGRDLKTTTRSKRPPTVKPASETAHETIPDIIISDM